MFMVTSESSKVTDKVRFAIETLEGEYLYQYDGINESLQEKVVLEPGSYLISWGVMAENSRFDLTMKMEIDRQ